MATPSTTLELAGRSMTFVWNAPARFRLHTLPGFEGFTGIAYFAAVLWAADPSKRWKTPEELAEPIEAANPNDIVAAVDALFAAPDDQKKSSSMSGPSPATTSASQTTSSSDTATTNSPPSPSVTAPPSAAS